MKNIFYIAGLAIISFLFALCASQVASTNYSIPITITEFMASNKEAVTDAEGKSPDWIELTNQSSDSVDLGGYFISNNLIKPLKHQFSNCVFGPNESKVFWASGKDSLVDHLSFKLNKKGGEIVLMSPDRASKLGEVVYGEQPSDYSSVWTKKGWKLSDQPSPGDSNSAEKLIDGIAEEVQFQFTKDSSRIMVSLSSEQEGEIRYTIDGTSSLDQTTSEKYTVPFYIDTTNVIVTAALYSPSLLTLSEKTATYIDDSLHELPVVSLTTNPDNLWHEETGMYVKGKEKNANYDNRSDAFIRAGSVEYRQSTGASFSQNIDFKLYGSGTRKRPKKSFTIKSKDGIPNHFFDSVNKEKIDGFVLRSCYSESSRYKNEVVKGVNDRMQSELLMQEYHPVVVYVNGKYWGVYNLSERKNDNFVKTHYGEKVKHMLRSNRSSSNAEKGSREDFYNFIEQLNAIDIKSEEAFNLITSEFELASLLDFWCQELYTLKTDRFNNRQWKSSKDDAKWRLIGFDFDLGFVWPDNPRTKIEFKDAPAKGIHFFGKMMQNPMFSAAYFERLSDYMNFGYTKEVVSEILEKADDLTRKEFKNDYARWKKEYDRCMDDGENQKKKILKFLEPRSVYLRDSIAAGFGYTEKVQITNPFPDEFEVYVNGFLVKDTAIYFIGMELDIEVKNSEGKSMTYWMKNSERVKINSPVSFSSSGVLMPYKND